MKKEKGRIMAVKGIHIRGYPDIRAVTGRIRSVVPIVSGISVFYAADKLHWLYRFCRGPDEIKRLSVWMDNIPLAFSNGPVLSIDTDDLLAGIITTGIMAVLFISHKENMKHYRKGTEYGSAVWGRPGDIRPYMDKDMDNNIILTKTESLMLSGRPKNLKYARNKNVLVIGGSGSGKTRFYVKANLMQCAGDETETGKQVSFVVSDPKGTLVTDCGQMLIDHGYDLKVLNTVNFKKSMRYNPFAYIKSEKDILKLVNTLIANTKGEGEKAEQDFWVKAEKLYYTALIAYIHYELPPEDHNISSLTELIDASDTCDDNDNFKNAVDLLFDDLGAEEPDHFAVRQYKKYKLAAGKTAKSILISCAARLAPFDIAELRNLMSDDELSLDTIGDKKTALFIITSDTDSTFDFVSALCISQMMNTLCTKADDEYGGSLPVHVRCLFDEFGNIKIPDMQRLIAVIRSREISASLILQSKSQLKAVYKEQAETIEGNCDSLLFLGGKEKETLKDLAELLGKETIDLYNETDTRGNHRSYALNYAKTGKDLMSRDELAVMDGGKCILQIRGIRPFLSEKYDITRHPRYCQLADYSKRNALDIQKYLETKETINKDEEFDLYEFKK